MLMVILYTHSTLLPEIISGQRSNNNQLTIYYTVKKFIFMLLTLCVTLTQAQMVCIGHSERGIKKEWKHVGYDTSFTDFEGRECVRYVLSDGSFTTFAFEDHVCVQQVNGYPYSNLEVVEYMFDKIYVYIDGQWQGTDIKGMCFSANVLCIGEQMIILYQRLPACG